MYCLNAKCSIADPMGALNSSFLNFFLCSEHIIYRKGILDGSCAKDNIHTYWIMIAISGFVHVISSGHFWKKIYNTQSMTQLDVKVIKDLIPRNYYYLYCLNAKCSMADPTGALNSSPQFLHLLQTFYTGHCRCMLWAFQFSAIL